MNKNSPYYRPEKIASAISLALGQYMRRGRIVDARLLNYEISFTNVIVSKDLKLAKCYFLCSKLNNNLAYIEDNLTELKNKDKIKEDLVEALKNSKYAIRDFVTKTINLRYSPELRFYYDNLLDI